MNVRDLITDSIWIENPKRIENPTVSIFLPTFSRFKNGLLAQCVKTLLAQTIKDLELIFIDDGSFDGTANYISGLMNEDFRVSCIRHPRNVGIPAISEYEAYTHSSGKYIFFGFDDNAYRFDALEKLVNFAKDNKYKAVRGIAKYPGPNGDLIDFPDLELSNLLSNNFIANSSVLLDREIIEDIGFFDPHILLLRNCDLDFWRRIIRKYEFPILKTHISTEYGSIQSDSLGNTKLMDLWACNEYMALDRNDLLRPKQFLDNDIFNLPSNVSARTHQIAHDLANEYIAQLSCEESPKKKDYFGITEQRNVLFITDNNISASEILCFEDLPENTRKKIMFLNPYYQRTEFHLIANSSCMIISRRFDNPYAQPWIEYAKALSIPVYFFVDDNFVALGYYDEKEYALALEKFDGILASSQELKSFFEKIVSNKKIFLFPIVNKNIPPTPQKKTYDTIKIAFMGGDYREDCFIEFVYPAIRKLSEEFSIDLYLPDTFTKVINFSSKGNLKINYYKRDISYYPVLNYLLAQNIDIMVNPSPDILNNRYKTLNSLLTSCILGAVLVTSDVYPYSKLNNKALVCVHNTIEKWYSVLHHVVFNHTYRFELLNHALEYCKNNYIGKINEQVIDDILDSCSDVSRTLEITRCHKLTHAIRSSTPILLEMGLGSIVNLLIQKLQIIGFRNTIMIVLNKMKRTIFTK